MDNKVNEPENQEEVSSLKDSDVTAHTSAMWKYNPIPDAPEKYPEYRRSYGSDPDGIISVTAARVRGKMHKHDGTNCDDWYEYGFSGGMAFAAVADGAGSKKFSRIGAKVSCEAAVASMKKSFSEYFEKGSEALTDVSKPFDDSGFNRVCSELAGFIRNAAIDGITAAEEEADRRSTDKELTDAAGAAPVLSDFSATLLLAAVIPLSCDGEEVPECLVLSVQIGDGMIAAVNSEAEASAALSLLGAADSGEFSGETDFITSPKMKLPEEIMKRTKITRRRCTDILLMTDGVADDYFPNDPEILRLYMDLAANGIVFPKEKGDKEKCGIDIPDAQKNIWVNDNDVTYEFQYMSAVAEKAELDTKSLWESADIRAAAALKNFTDNIDKNPSKQLERWLDNYVRRGSFDDRTLLIISTGANGKGAEC